MQSKISLLPLTDNSSFIDGKYGIERCTIRGIVRIFKGPALIHRLSLIVNGMTHSHVWDSISAIKRTKVLFQQEAVLLKDFKLESKLDYFDIPFDIAVPGYDAIPAVGFGPCSQLLPCGMTQTGRSGYKDEFSCKHEYSITATLSSPSIIPFFSSYLIANAKVPFLVYDPRLIPLLLHPESRNWKSHVGAVPLEYDICLGATVLGARDTLVISYKMLINPEYAQMGVRIKMVTFTLRQYSWAGEDRCCVKDDMISDPWGHGKPVRVRGQQDLVRWSQVEFPPPESSSNAYTRNSTQAYTFSDTKYRGLAVNNIYPGSDGIYASRIAELRVPGPGGFNASTARPVVPSDDQTCHYVRPRKAYFATKHTIICAIEMKGADTLTIEAGIYLSGIGKRDCELLLETDPDITPPLDYQKIVGPDLWVPEYTKDTKDTQAPPSPGLGNDDDSQDHSSELEISFVSSAAPGHRTPESPPPTYLSESLCTHKPVFILDLITGVKQRQSCASCFINIQ